MPLTEPEFKIKSKDAINDSAQKDFLANAQQQYAKRHINQGSWFSNYALAKNRAAFIRWKAIESLDKHLIQFESNCIKAGIKVLWALDNAQALLEVSSIINKHNIKSLLLDKYSLAAELGLEQQLNKNKGLILTCSSKQEPYLVKSYIHDTIRCNNGSAFSGALSFDASIMQAAFITADSGTLFIADYTVNATVKYSTSKVSIILVSIDTVLPSLNDAELILSLQSGYSSAGGTIPLLKIISSVKKANDDDGNDTYVLLIDNGRSNLLETEQQRQLLYCIQCGACQAFCPVVASIGSTGADDVHSGPLAFSSLPQWKGKKDYSYLSYSSPLCGKCNEVCPVKIDFKKAMLATRHDAVKNKLNSKQEKLFYFFWKKTMLKREFINWNNINAYRKAVETIFLKSRSGLRKFALAESKSFNQQWRERIGIK